jgi:hypothetical protein
MSPKLEFKGHVALSIFVSACGEICANVFGSRLYILAATTRVILLTPPNSFPLKFRSVSVVKRRRFYPRLSVLIKAFTCPRTVRE